MLYQGRADNAADIRTDLRRKGRSIQGHGQSANSLGTSRDQERAELIVQADAARSVLCLPEEQNGHGTTGPQLTAPLKADRDTKATWLSPIHSTVHLC